MHPALSASSPAGNYLDWGVIHISYTNLGIIAVMLLLFVLALLLPFPKATDLRPARVERADDEREDRP